jgi:phenylalanyl-tRNA synthetase beta chain
MKTPLSWLTDYVPLSAPPAEVAHKLTFSGIELEGMETFGGQVDGVIVGEVRAVEKHPQADKLSVCRVFDGTQEHQVVCGAPNVTAGGKYPFAPIGAVLLGGELKIKKAKLRGVESFGMLCAADELGLGSDHAGLMTLNPAAAPGTPMAELLGPPDTVFELEITPNRPDCLSMIGIARELAALYRIPLNRPDPQPAATGPDTASTVSVTVDAPADCPRYTARILRNVTIAPSPAWLASRLEKAGIRPINNIVDITNYVMLETGHPLHAFDLRQIAGGQIHVRRARPGETMATLDGIERKLDPDMLVIADPARPVALAGVMGGAGSEIQPDTTTVLLEAATFAPAIVRHASRSLMLFTDSSYRFERGVNPASVDWASRRAAALMIELAGATLDTGAVDVAAPATPPRTVTLRGDRARSLLGIDLDDRAMADLLRAIELDVASAPDHTLAVTIPSFRFDLEREVDLIEEIARLHGLDNIAPVPSLAPPPADENRTVREVSALRERLIALGLQEIITYSLVSEPLMNLFNPADAPARIALPRPVTTDQALLRTALLPQMVETLGRNRARQVTRAALFEIGTVYHLAPAGTDHPYRETRRLAIGLMGRPAAGGILDRKPPTREDMFAWCKGLWERIAAAYRLGDTARLEPSDQPPFEPGYGFTLLIDGQPAGTLGLAAPAIRKEWRLHDPVGLLELDVAPLAHRPATTPVYHPVPTFPAVVRDVALVADAALPHARITDAMRRAAPPELEQIDLFDIFMGDAIGPGRRSLAYALTYRSPARTLTDDEVNGYHDKVKQTLKQELGVEIRES